MPTTAHSLPVTGSISDGDGSPQVVLTERLVGYDTFLTGVLDIGQQRVPVRIITLDDVTVLRPVEATALAGATDTYSGVLHLPHGSRRRTIPKDLALEVSRRHRTLDLLDEAELRYALTFLEEATTATIRQARIAVIADAVASVDNPAAEDPENNDGDHSAAAAPALVTVDVGGTIGTTDRPGITAALVAASPLARRDAVRLLRERLHTAPAITDQVVEDVCRTLRIPVTAFPRQATPTPLRLFTFAAAALEQISALLPVVTLSNVTCVEADLPQLRQLLAPWVTDHFPSCRIGHVKPDPRAFEAVAAQRRIDPTQMVHIGDDWECDILGATRVGARAIWISGARPVPDASEAVKSNVLVATDLAAAAEHVRAICTGEPPMSTFAGTVEHYRKYRPGIPQEVADVLAAAVPDRHPRRLLDIGTGTGLVVEALLTRFDDIIAIDNDADMLASAETAMRPMIPKGTRMVLQRFSAEEFTPPQDWHADLVTICRAFHWLDQAAVLQRLSSQVVEDGAVAIFGDNSFWVASSPWKTAVRSVIQDFLGEQRRAGAGVFNHHNRPYSEIMQESAFDQVEEFRVPVHRVWSTESILGYLYSTSFAAPHLFGDRLADFEATVTHTLTEFSSDDTFDEENEFLIRIGRRSQA